MKENNTLRNFLQKWDALLFPPYDIYARQISLLAQFLFVVVVAAIAGIFAHYFFRPVGFIGFDWTYYFGKGLVEGFYPPWDHVVVAYLTWDTLVGFSVAGVTLAIIRRAVHPISAVAAMLSLPVLWTIFLGQLDGLVLLGLAALPWLTPVGLIKPQISIFAFGARRNYIIGFLIWIVISFAIWGPWPLEMLKFRQYPDYVTSRLVTDISLQGWGLLFVWPLFWIARGDMDLLMYSGAFATLYLVPYNLIPAAPAIARLRPQTAIVACLLSWLPFSANWLGHWGWWLGWLFIGFMWVCLAASRHPQFAPTAWWRRVFIAPPPAQALTPKP
jgi:hypothetical protein